MDISAGVFQLIEDLSFAGFFGIEGHREHLADVSRGGTPDAGDFFDLLFQFERARFASAAFEAVDAFFDRGENLSAVFAHQFADIIFR